MHLDRLLEIFTKEFHLDAVPLKDKQGVHQLKLSDDLEIGISETEPGVYFSSLMMPIPKKGNKESLFLYLMKANLLGQGTGRGAIGIDPTEKHLTFSLLLPSEISYAMFKDRLEDFVNYLYFWREEIPRSHQTLL